jgi:hypothetical protein
MPLLGHAAMLLSFDVVDAAIADHDDWHTREHLAERLSIPGFRRGTRWVHDDEGDKRAAPRYFVVYEVDSLATLTSEPYLRRLNHPSAWTQRVMPHYRGMSRGFCAIAGSVGIGLGQVGLRLVFTVPPDGDVAPLRRWLVDELLPPLPAIPGLCSAHVFEPAATPPMTNEQRIRGADAAPGWTLFVTGYRAEALKALAREALAPPRLAAQGLLEPAAALYRIDHTVTHDEVGRP